MNSTEKSSFTSRFGLIASGAAAAIGLGNIWRFPAEVAMNGGGIYLLFYLLFSAVIGFPMVVSELALGRHKQKGNYGAYEEPWSWMRSLSPMIAWTVLGFYHVLSGWVLAYIIKILRSNLLGKGNYKDLFSSVQANASHNIFFTGVIVLVVALVSQNEIKKGLERLSKIVMPLFLCIIICLVGYAFTLPNTKKAVSFYLLPKWDHLSLKGIISALNQSFMSLGVGAGVSVAYGSYIKKEESLMKSSLIIVISDVLVAFLAGFFLFPILFSQNPIANPEAQGPALTFIQLPAIFTSLGSIMGTTVGSLFFVLLLLAAITSSVALLEVPIQFLQHRYNVKRGQAVWFLVLTNLLLSGAIILSHANWPFFNFTFLRKDLMDWVIFIAVDIAQPLVAVLCCIYIRTKWKTSSLIEEIEEGGKLKKWNQFFMTITVSYIAPFTIVGTLLFTVIQLFSPLLITVFL